MSTILFQAFVRLLTKIPVRSLSDGDFSIKKLVNSVYLGPRELPLPLE